MSIYVIMAGAALLMAAVLGRYARFSSFDYRKALMSNYAFLILGFAAPVGMAFAKMEIPSVLLTGVTVYFFTIATVVFGKMVLIAIREDKGEKSAERDRIKSQLDDEDFLLNNMSINKLGG